MSDYVDTRFEHAGLICEVVSDDDASASDPQDHDNAGKIVYWGDSRYSLGDEQLGETPDWEITCPNCDGAGDDPNGRHIVVDARIYGRRIIKSDLPSLEAAERWIERHQPGDAEYMSEIADCEKCEGSGSVQGTPAEWFHEARNAALTILLSHRESHYNSLTIGNDADLANAAIYFTQAEIDHEWSGHIDPYNVTMQGTGEVREYDGARSYAEARVEEYGQWLAGNVWGIVVRERDPEIEDPNDDSEGTVLESVWGFIGDPGDEWILSELRATAEGCRDQIEHEKAEAFRWACADVVTR